MGNIHTARRTAFDILVAAQKMADLDPRGVSKVSPYFEVEESILGLSFTQLRGFATILSNQPKIRHEGLFVGL